MENIKYCILTDEKDIIEYEKGLYKAFSSDKWMMENYIIEDNRMRSKIPYKNQEIYGVKKNNLLIAGAAINFNKKLELQIEQMGFKISKEEKSKNICDGLNMYFLENLLGEDFITVSISFGEFVLKRLKQKGIETWYGTCSKKIKSIYSIFGWEFIDSKIISGEEELLIKFNIQEF